MCWSTPVHSACASGFGGRAGSQHKSHLSSGCAGSYHLGRRWSWRWRGGELEPGVSRGFFSAQWLSLPYWGWGWVPSCWSRRPEGRIQAGSHPCKGVLSPFPEPAPSPSGEQCWSKRGWCEHSEWLAAWAVASGWGQRPRLLLMYCLCKPQW